MEIQETSHVLNNFAYDITQETPDTTGFQINGWKILLMPVKAPDKTQGGIIIPDSTRHDLQSITSLCRVLKVGPLAYSSEIYEGEPWCKPGDFVLISRNTGLKISYNGLPLIIASDSKIEAVIENPELLLGFDYEKA